MSTFNPNVTNITFIKGFISNNTFTIFIKDNENNNEVKWKITCGINEYQNYDNCVINGEIIEEEEEEIYKKEEEEKEEEIYKEKKKK